MGVRTDPSALRWLIGAELSRHRREVPLSLSELATASGIGKPKLGHMESGRYHQAPQDVETVLRACDAAQPAIDRLTAMAATRPEAKTWLNRWTNIIPDWFQVYLGLEGMADASFIFEPMVIPGLLQTREYALSMTRSTGFFRPDQSDTFAALRHLRSSRLTDDDPLTLHAIIGEAALRMPVGGPDVRQVQLDHLVRMSGLPNITIQVLRPENGPHQAASVGQFALLDFDDVRPVAYTELLDDAVYVSDLDRIRTYQWVSNNLRQVALSPEDSRAMIREFAGVA
nr:helix-turn-helix transcriptional regulator [Micromonospora sp. DSM 115978]